MVSGVGQAWADMDKQELAEAGRGWQGQRSIFILWQSPHL